MVTEDHLSNIVRKNVKIRLQKRTIQELEVKCKDMDDSIPEMRAKIQQLEEEKMDYEGEVYRLQQDIIQLEEK